LHPAAVGLNLHLELQSLSYQQILPGEEADHAHTIRFLGVSTHRFPAPHTKRSPMVLDTRSHGADTELAVRASRGDRNAFAELYARHQAEVYGYFRARVLNPSGIDDLSQEVFLRAFDALPKYDPAQRFIGWLKGICRNVLREYIRRARRRKEIAWTELCLELEELAPEGPYDDFLQFLPRCMDMLNDSSSEALRLHYMGGQRVDAIAREMNRTKGAVKVLMVRARQALRRCIVKRMGGDV
jgi:RNA polymerase sigma-70 factor (ECF subfamily)